MARTASWIAIAAVSFGACSARSDLPVGARDVGDDDGGGGGGADPEPCDPPPCADITRGVFRLLGDDDSALGWLFLFDATACNGAPTHYFVSIGDERDDSRRYADLVVTEASHDLLIATADNHGGTIWPECGGAPDHEEVTLRLDREGCEAHQYRLTLNNSEDASPYTVSARAVRCRCEIGWPACGGPLPEELCAF